MHPKTLESPQFTALITNPDVQYGEAGGESLLLDAHVPVGQGPYPLIILVHGGGWSSGDKRGDISEIFAPLSQGDFTWFSIGYRLAPTHQWPAQLQDLGTATRWVKAHAAEYKADPDRIGLVGYSAGGQLVCLAAASEEPEARVQCVVGLAPVTDFVADVKRRGGISEALRNLIGDRATMQNSQPVLEEMSPLNAIHRDLPPVLLVHGTEDQSVPYAQSCEFQKRSQNVGGRCELLTIDNASHRLSQWNNFDPDYQQTVVAWLRGQLQSEAAEAQNVPEYCGDV